RRSVCPRGQNRARAVPTRRGLSNDFAHRTFSCFMSAPPNAESLLKGAEVGNLDAKMSRSTNDRSVAWDGIDPNLCPERTGHKSYEVRKYRQDGFPDPAICPVLFLCPVRGGIPLAYRDDAPVFPFRDYLVDRGVVLPGGAVVVLVEPDFLSAELSSRH